MKVPYEYEHLIGQRFGFHLVIGTATPRLLKSIYGCSVLKVPRVRCRCIKCGAAYYVSPGSLTKPEQPSLIHRECWHSFRRAFRAEYTREPTRQDVLDAAERGSNAGPDDPEGWDLEIGALLP